MLLTAACVATRLFYGEKGRVPPLATTMLLKGHLEIRLVKPFMWYVASISRDGSDRRR
jgi:hypothetical protein